jgi:hypothetical protein
MKFLDYNAKYDELWKEVRAADDAFHGGPPPPTGRPLDGPRLEWGDHVSHRVFDAFRKPMNRRYWISERAYVGVSPQGSAKFPYVADCAVRWEYDGQTGMNDSPGPHKLTPAEHRTIGDVIEVVEAWVAGEIDALPPSGIWSEVKP